MATRSGKQLLLDMIEAVEKEGSMLSFYMTLTEKEATKLKDFTDNLGKLTDIALTRFEEHRKKVQNNETTN